jgi:sulfate transport system permease protein
MLANGGQKLLFGAERFGQPERATAFAMTDKKFNPLPGFGLTMGYTLLYLSVLVLLPLAGLFLRAFHISPGQFWGLITNARALAAFKLTFGASLLAASLNAVFGALLAWVLTRYDFFGRRLIDAMVDFPFALPTAVAGLTLCSLFGPNGWLGRFLVPLGIHGVYTRLGIVIALTFVGLPFVVRTLQPVLQNMEQEVEEAAATLGASRLRTFVQILAPTLFPTVLTGFALAFARAVGEYGSIAFVSGNLPRTEIVPSLIVDKLQGSQDVAGATAIAATLLVLSFAVLATINWLEGKVGSFNE